MVIDIYASILKPTDAGDHLIIVSGFPAEPGGGAATFQNRTGKAKSAQEAKALAERLAADLKDELERFGHQVGAVHMRLQ